MNNAGKQTPMHVRELERGVVARISAIDSENEGLAAKLRELGLAEGDEIELWARGPFGGEPIAIRLNRTIIALRHEEAAAILLTAAK